jgi:hypothetical protein
MKYLKEYNDHNSSYEEITFYVYNEYMSLKGHDRVLFSEKELELVREIFKNARYFSTTQNATIFIHSFIYIIYIYKMVDEWYYIDCEEVETVHKKVRHYYKCDQMHGLIDCLTMLKNKHYL